jgi:hypothetical protein
MYRLLTGDEKKQALQKELRGVEYYRTCKRQSELKKISES